MKFIKLTSLSDGKPVYVNVDHIGHMYEVPAKVEYSRETEAAHTRLGVTTHNNGGFRIVESIAYILKMIEKK